MIIIKLFVLLITTAVVHSDSTDLVPSVKGNVFVVGGTDVEIEDYPFVVVCYGNWGFSCGGSILNEEYVLTAGHCTCRKIQYGVTKRDINGPNIIDVAQSIRYPGYISYTRNDIQILRLAKKITFGPNARPVKLPRPRWEVRGNSYETRSAVFGWGYDTSGYLPYTLQRGDYFVVNNTDCQKIHSAIGYNVYDFNCCNGVRGGGVADCNGDSGGPIVVWINGCIVQYGIVSWSVKPCTNPTYPAVGTKTSHYVVWISRTTKIPLFQLMV